MKNRVPSSHPSPATLLVVFVALMALLALTVGLAFVPFGNSRLGHWLPLALAMSIAAAKGGLIVLEFMNVKRSSRTTWTFVSMAFVWLAILLVLMMSDYLTRNHPPGASPKGEPRYIGVA